MSDASNDAMKRAQSTYQERPKVPPRSEEFVTVSATSIEPLLTDANESKYIASKVRKHKVVRNSILLEETAQDKLGKHCDRTGLIKAVWIEAAFWYLQDNEEAMKKVDSAAAELLAIRKAATKYRQAKTVSDRLKEY